MVRRLRSLAALFALSATLAPSAMAATAKPLKITTAGQKGIPNITKPVRGTVTKSTFGPGTSVVTIHAPHTSYAFTFKGGTIEMTADPTLSGLNVVGHWTITGATGRYAGMTGSGTMKGSLTGAPFVFSGRYRD